VKNKYRSTLGRNTTRESDGTMRLQKKRDFGEWGMRHNVWHINTSGQELMCQHIDHPATFSQELAKDHILSWSNEGDVILDPFMGSGTTALMALVTGRQFIGCEINSEYVHLSECRIEKEAGLLWYAAQRREAS
jgi:DNA modification methylase